MTKRLEPPPARQPADPLASATAAVAWVIVANKPIYPVAIWWFVGGGLEASLATLVAAPLYEVANQEKLLPPDFIRADGFGITDAARRYLAPLIVGEAYPPFKNGLPDYVRLQNMAAPRKLAAEFTVSIE